LKKIRYEAGYGEKRKRDSFEDKVGRGEMVKDTG
jgi:hypothetical protein